MNNPNLLPPKNGTAHAPHAHASDAVPTASIPPLHPNSRTAPLAPAPSGSAWPLILGLLAAAAVAGGGAYYAFFYKPAAPVAAAPAPFPVAVETVAAQKLRLWSEFSGRLHAVDYAELRPEVGGRITEVRFEDGQSVKAGDLLFVIDPRPYEAAVARAEAKIASAQAALQFAKSDQDRAAALIASHAVAQRDVDQANNASLAAAAALDSAQAELKTAALDLEHAYVKAPIPGRVSHAEITVGNLVQSGPGAPVLTSIVSDQGIYADFEVDEQTYLETIRDTASGNAQERLIPVQLVVANDGGRVYDGFIQSFDNRIDAASGTIRARARFENADGALLPGMFVSVKLASSRERSALLIPERAIGSDQSKKFVFVVGEGNKVAYREVTLGKPVRERRIVEQGLQPGDRVIVDGILHVRPNAVVAPQEQPAQAAAPAVAAQ